jgi:hypothetical protein
MVLLLIREEAATGEETAGLEAVGPRLLFIRQLFEPSSPTKVSILLF